MLTGLLHVFIFFFPEPVNIFPWHDILPLLTLFIYEVTIQTIYYHLVDGFDRIYSQVVKVTWTGFLRWFKGRKRCLFYFL